MECEEFDGRMNVSKGAVNRPPFSRFSPIVDTGACDADLHTTKESAIDRATASGDRKTFSALRNSESAPRALSRAEKFHDITLAEFQISLKVRVRDRY